MTILRRYDLLTADKRSQIAEKTLQLARPSWRHQPSLSVNSLRIDDARHNPPGREGRGRCGRVLQAREKVLV